MGKIRGRMGGMAVFWAEFFAVYANFYADFMNVLKYVTITR